MQTEPEGKIMTPEEKTRYLSQIHDRASASHARFYNIAGIVLQVESDLPIGKTTFHDKLRIFETDGPGEDTILIRHHFVDSPPVMLESDRLINRQSPWSIYRRDDSWIYIATPDEPSETAFYQYAVASGDYSRIDIYNPGSSAFSAGGLQSLTLFPTDQILLSQILALREAFYIHSSGVIYKNSGLLFIGHSEAGKSTMVKMLMDRAKILCDDRIIVRRWPEGFRIHGNWSHGEVPAVSPDSSPLKAVFLLIKDTQSRCVRVESTREIITNLLDCLIKPFTPAAWWDRILALVGSLATEVPFYRLYSDKSRKVIDLLDQI